MELLCELAIAKDPDLKVSEDSHMELDLGFDSLDRMHLMFKFRERYGVTITAEDYIDRKLAIVKNLLDYIAASTG
nr:acyl carrier protein [Nitrospirota bacterium]